MCLHLVGNTQIHIVLSLHQLLEFSEMDIKYQACNIFCNGFEWNNLRIYPSEKLIFKMPRIPEYHLEFFGRRMSSTLKSIHYFVGSRVGSKNDNGIRKIGQLTLFIGQPTIREHLQKYAVYILVGFF